VVALDSYNFSYLAREGFMKIHGNTKHGMKKTKTWEAWHGIKQRCHNPNVSQYQYYGARGIAVCDHWRYSFENFYNDMGECPPGYSIDRMNVDGNYEPSNCRWATEEEQRNNKTTSVFVEYEGERLTAAQMARKLEVPYKLFKGRLDRGWSIDKIITTPVRAHKEYETALLRGYRNENIS
jgi:hypothetical protein